MFEGKFSEEQCACFKKTFVQRVIRRQCESFVLENSKSCVAIGETMIASDVFSPSAAGLLDREINEVFVRHGLPPELEHICKNLLVKIVDQRIVEYIANSGSRCTFGNGVAWNSIVTILDTDMGINLALTRETISVLMMSHALCDNPQMKQDICPHLGLPTVLFLLLKQIPDDFNPARNNVEKFMRHFHLTPGSQCCATVVECTDDFDGVFDKLSRDWRSNHFTEEQLAAFPYLRTFF
jgi:hypothetical protein